MNPEADVSRAHVIASFLGLQAEVAEQSGHQCQVKLLVGRLGLVQAPALLTNQRSQLAVDVMPLAHAHWRQEMLPQQRYQLALGALVRDLFVIPLPELEVGHEFGFVVAKPCVGKLCGLARLHRAIARVLHGKRRGDDEKLVETLLLARGKDHPA